MKTLGQGRGFTSQCLVALGGGDAAPERRTISGSYRCTLFQWVLPHAYHGGEMELVMKFHQHDSRKALSLAAFTCSDTLLLFLGKKMIVVLDIEANTIYAREYFSFAKIEAFVAIGAVCFLIASTNEESYQLLVVSVFENGEVRKLKVKINFAPTSSSKAK